MKTTLVRLFVLSLAVAGFGAATVTSHARTVNKASVAPLGTIGSQTLCGPNNPGPCGMD